MRYEPQGLDRYRAFDPSISRTRIANSQHVPSWQSVMIRCLQNGDNEAAQLIKDVGERALEEFLDSLEPKVEVPDLEEAERIKRALRAA